MEIDFYNLIEYPLNISLGLFALIIFILSWRKLAHLTREYREQGKSKIVRYLVLLFNSIVIASSLLICVLIVLQAILMSLYIGYYGYITGVTKEFFRATFPGLSPEVVEALTFPFFLPSARSLIAFYIILYLILETILFPFIREKSDFKPPFQAIVEKLLKYDENIPIWPV